MLIVLLNLIIHDDIDKGELSLCLIKHHAVLTSALDGGE
jgi:hypothetical protein